MPGLAVCKSKALQSMLFFNPVQHAGAVFSFCMLP